MSRQRFYQRLGLYAQEAEFFDAEGDLRDHELIDTIHRRYAVTVLVTLALFCVMGTLADSYLDPYLPPPLFFPNYVRPAVPFLPSLIKSAPWMLLMLALFAYLFRLSHKSARTALQTEFTRLDNLALQSNDWQDERLRRRWLEEARAQYPNDEVLLIALNAKWKKKRARPFHELATCAAKYCDLTRDRADTLLRLDADEPRKLLELLTGRSL